MCILEYKTKIMTKIIKLFKRLFGFKEEVIVTTEPTKKKRKPRPKRKPKPKVINDSEKLTIDDKPKKKRKPRPKRKPKNDGGKGQQPIK